ncbi:MAG: hypothetical protein AAFO87_10095 [Cyanobacteria bacterium J06607_6]
MTWLVYRSLSALSRLICIGDNPRFVVITQWWTEPLGEGMKTAAIALREYFLPTGSGANRLPASATEVS